MNQWYRKKGFVMFPAGNGFIVYNAKKIFKESHTHVRKFKVGRTLIDLAIKKKLPKNPYLTDNLIRISEDKEYIKRLKELKESKMTHKDFKKLMESRSEIDVGKING